MKYFKPGAAVILSALIAVESVHALSSGSASSSSFAFTIPSSIGYISDTYRPASAGTRYRAAPAGRPDFILIQDLHVNRSVQFAISKILKRLKTQGLMPDHIAVEGETGPVEMRVMQRYPNALIRKKAADYLVQQGEMPGAMHFAVSEGEGGLFGIETDEYYQANLEMFRRSYIGRTALRKEIEKIQAALPKLKKDPAARSNALILEKDLEAVNQLINNQIIPDELIATLKQANQAVDHLKQVLPQETSANLVEPLSAAVNFYALALLRDEELFKNSLAVRELGRQTTTIVITGGFHTQALAQMCKRRGFSYAVITPNVKRHDKVDEQLYLARLLDQHLTPEQVETGRDWASMQMLAVLWRKTNALFSRAYAMAARRSDLSTQIGESLEGGVSAAAQALCPTCVTHQNAPSTAGIPRRTFLRRVITTTAGLFLTARSIIAQVQQADVSLPRILNWVRQNHMELFPDVPKSFQVPANLAPLVWKATVGRTPAESLIQRAILDRGLVVYDGALAQLLWLLGGDLQKAAVLSQGYMDKREISTFSDLRGYYIEGDSTHPFQYGEGTQGRLNSTQGWLFRVFADIWEKPDPLTKASVQWQDWKPIAGENAWAAMAALHIYRRQFPKQVNNSSVELSLARGLTETALLMQADIGGVRFAPQRTFTETSDRIDGNYYVISTENNLSWYGAFRMLSEITKEPKYAQAMARQEKYFQWAWNKAEGVFAQGGNFRPGRGWAQNPAFATDCQTWAVLSLGTDKIDAWFGDGAAYRMLQKTFEKAGIKNSAGGLLGVDFTDYRALNRMPMVSVEWTAGAVMAARAAAAFYAKTHPDWAAQLRAQADSMWRHLLTTGVKRGDWTAFPYATGKASEGHRTVNRATGFGWNAAVEEVLSLASTGWMALVSVGFNPFYLPGAVGNAVAQAIEPEPRISPLRQAMPRRGFFAAFGLTLLLMIVAAVVPATTPSRSTEIVEAGPESTRPFNGVVELFSPTLEAQEAVPTKPAMDPVNSRVGSGTNEGWFSTPPTEIPAGYFRATSPDSVTFEVRTLKNAHAFKKFQLRLLGHPSGRPVILDGERVQGQWSVVLPKEAGPSLTVSAKTTIISIPGPDETELGVRVFILSDTLAEIFKNTIGAVKWFFNTGRYVLQDPNKKLNSERVEVSVTVTKPVSSGAENLSRPLNEKGSTPINVLTAVAAMVSVLSLLGGAVLSAQGVTPEPETLKITESILRHLTLINWIVGSVAVGIVYGIYRKVTRSLTEERVTNKKALSYTVLFIAIFTIPALVISGGIRARHYFSNASVPEPAKTVITTPATPITPSVAQEPPQAAPTATSTPEPEVEAFPPKDTAGHTAAPVVEPTPAPVPPNLIQNRVPIAPPKETEMDKPAPAAKPTASLSVPGQVAVLDISSEFKSYIVTVTRKDGKGKPPRMMFKLGSTGRWVTLQGSGDNYQVPQNLLQDGQLIVVSDDPRVPVTVTGVGKPKQNIPSPDNQSQTSKNRVKFVTALALAVAFLGSNAVPLLGFAAELPGAGINPAEMASGLPGFADFAQGFVVHSFNIVIAFISNLNAQQATLSHLRSILPNVDFQTAVGGLAKALVIFGVAKILADREMRRRTQQQLSRMATAVAA